jgi:hypothetical protein
MMSGNVGRTAIACVAAFATALQLGACNRAENSRKSARVAEPQVSAASSQPEPSVMLPGTPTAPVDEAAAPKASAAPMKPMSKDDETRSISRPAPAKPLFDPRKGFGTLEPPRLLEA